MRASLLASMTLVALRARNGFEDEETVRAMVREHVEGIGLRLTAVGVSVAP